MVSRMSKFGKMIAVATFAVVMGMSVASCDSTIHFYPGEVREHAARPRIDIDWSGYHKDLPTGVTVVCHCVTTGKKTTTTDNNINFVFPALDHNRHWTTAYNLTENEFNYIGFRGFEAYETEEVFAREITSPAWCKVRSSSSSYLAGQPEWFAVDTIKTVLVEDAIHNATASSVSIGTLHPKNIIYTLHIKLHTENIGNLISARASISGLANGRLIASDVPNDNSVTVTHIIQPGDWTRSRTDIDHDVGMVKADIRCFGLPSNHIGSADENILEFHAMLADGKTVWKYVVPVGHLITEGNSPPGKRGDNLDLYLDLRLDPPLPPGGDGDWGIDVWVDDWDQEPDVDIPFQR